MDDVTDELHHCIDRIFDGSPIEALTATRRARELVALLEGRIIDLARAESSAGPPDAA